MIKLQKGMMMFIDKITICNIFAYYDKQSIEFTQDNNKSLFLIYGNNGYGKTSFIRACKLLFLGSGLLSDEPQNIPEDIHSFSKNSGVKLTSPIQFLQGNKNLSWRGALNDIATKEGLKDYYIEFVGRIDETDFSIKRSWTLSPMEEKLEVSIENEIFYNKNAQERIDKILPSEFVNFFFFDGEEIKKIVENLSSSLKDKVSTILQIDLLSNIIKQSNNLKEELKQKEINNKNDIINIKRLENDIESDKQEQDVWLKEVENFKQNINSLHNSIESLKNEKSSLIASQNKEYQKVTNEINIINNKIISLKENLPQKLKQIHILPSLLLQVQKEIQNIKNVANISDIDAFNRLSPYIKDILKSENLSNIDKIMSIIDNMPNKLNQEICKDENLLYNYMQISAINASIKNLKITNLKQDFEDIAKLKINLNTQKEVQNNIILDESHELRSIDIENEIKNASEKIKELESLKDHKNIKIGEIKTKILENEKKYKDLMSKIDTTRVEAKLKILENIQIQLEIYKDKRMKRITHKLPESILEKYKNILENDNIQDIKIDENFIIKLYNENKDEILIANQSEGQKQILAMSIVWAISELSRSKISLIIDTPLARIDDTNRQSIIKNYYSKATKQVIVLPLDSEINKKQCNQAREFIGGIYKIENETNRSHARLKKAGFEDIFPKE